MSYSFAVAVSMVWLSLADVVALYEEDNRNRKANKSANAPILALISAIFANCSNAETKKIHVERTKGGSIPNRGSVVECLIKLLYADYKTTQKGAKGQTDFRYNGHSYEVKYSSSKGYATYNPTQNYDRVIFVDGSGVYQCNSSAFVLDKCQKHIKTIDKKNARQLLKF